MKILKLIIFIFIFLSYNISDTFSYSKLSPVKTNFGLHQAEFLTNSGIVTVNLPSDMVPGETISGSVIFGGNTSQFDLIIEGKIINLFNNNFIIKLPTSITTGVVSVVLRYLNGVEIGRAFFPTNLVKLNKINNTSTTSFKLPLHGRSGIPSEVIGPFDGDYQNTSINLSGQKLTILAESTGKMVFLGSNTHKGPGILALSESGQNVNGKYTNLIVVKVGDEPYIDDKKIEVPKKTESLPEVADSTVKESVPEAKIKEKEFEDIDKVSAPTMEDEVEKDTEKREEVIEIIEKESVEVEKGNSYALVEGDLTRQFNSRFYDFSSDKYSRFQKEKPVTSKQVSQVKEIKLVDPKFEKKDSTENTNTSDQKFCVQLASFKKKSEADNFLARMNSIGLEGYIKEVDLPKKGKWNRVRIGGFNSRNEARIFSEKIDKKKLFINSVLITVED